MVADLLQVIGLMLLIIGLYHLFRAGGFINKNNPVYKNFLRIGKILTPIGVILLVIGIMLPYV